MFARARGAADQISDEAFADYLVDAPAIAEMRALFATWREELLADRGEGRQDG
jgi:hypothetical protein